MEPTRDVYEDQADQFWPSVPAEEQPDSDPGHEVDGEVAVPALATLACEEGLLTQEQVREGVAEGLRSGERLGEVLLRLGWLDERQLAGLIGRQRGMPFLDAVDLPDEPPDDTVLRPEQARAVGAVAVGYEDGQPLIALADPNDEQLVQLRSLFGNAFACAIVTKSTLDWLLERADGEADDGSAEASSSVAAKEAPPLSETASERDVQEPEPSDVAGAASAGKAAAAPDPTAESELGAPDVGGQDGGWHDLQAHLEQTDRLLGTLRLRFDDLRELEAAARRQLAEARHEGERLRAELGETTHEVERLQAELGDTTHEVERLQAELGERDAKLLDVRKRLGELSMGL